MYTYIRIYCKLEIKKNRLKVKIYVYKKEFK